jgi:hypothetical protein
MVKLEKITLSKVHFKEKLDEDSYFQSYICKVELEPSICFVYEKGLIDVEVVLHHVQTISL